MAQRMMALRGVVGLCTTGGIVASNHADADSNTVIGHRLQPLLEGGRPDGDDFELVDAATAKVLIPSGAPECDRNDSNRTNSHLSAAISAAPFRREEVAAAIDNISRRPEIFSRVLPPQLFSEMPHSAKCELFDLVMEAVLNNPDLIESTSAQIKPQQSAASDGSQDASIGSRSRSSTTESGLGPPLPSSAAFQNASQNLLWEELVAEHPCSICRDLLAAPVILGCSHTFCGSCIVEYMSACESEDAEVVHYCPQCRDEILAEPTYEKLLDGDLERSVEKVPECDHKAEWKQRRTDYLHYRRDRRSGKNSREDDEALTPFWKNVIELVVPALALAVIALLVAVRGFRVF